MVGNGDGAFDYYLRINPSAREEISDVHRCEPYVYAQMIAGRDAPTHGEAKNSWLTGHGGVELRRDHASGSSASAPSTTACGSSPRSCPRPGPAIAATRRFRGTTYEIEVRRDGPGKAVPPAGRRRTGRGHPGAAPGARHDPGAGGGQAAVTGHDAVTDHATGTSMGGRPSASTNGRSPWRRSAAAGPRIVGLRRSGTRRTCSPRPRPRLGDGERAVRAVRRPPAVVLARGPRPGRDPRLRRAS